MFFYKSRQPVELLLPWLPFDFELLGLPVSQQIPNEWAHIQQKVLLMGFQRPPRCPDAMHPRRNLVFLQNLRGNVSCTGAACFWQSAVLFYELSQGLAPLCKPSTLDISQQPSVYTLPDQM